jgi:hypothetical protein
VLSFAVWGWESDADYGEFSPSPLRPLGCWTSINAGHESSKDGDLARAVTNINLYIAPFVHTQSTATETWTFLSPSAAKKLRYKVYVTLNFNYGGSTSPIARRR